MASRPRPWRDLMGNDWPKDLYPENVKPLQICGGHEHVIYLVESGNVYSWGANSHGQMGRSGQTQALLRPKVIENLRTTPVCQIACGDRHTVALAVTGEVWVFGDNKSGQCAQDKETKTEQLPKMLKKSLFDNQKIRRIGAGMHSSVAVTQRGDVYVWGEVAARLYEVRPERPFLCMSPEWRKTEVEVTADDDEVPPWRGQPPEIWDELLLDQPAVWREAVVVTTAFQPILGDLDSKNDNMKSRISELRKEVRVWKEKYEQQKFERKANKRDDEFEGNETFSAMNKEMEAQRAELEQEFKQHEVDRVELQQKIAALRREVAVIDQHEAQLIHQYNQKDAELSAFRKQSGDAASPQVHALETQLNDIRLFRAANSKHKLDLLKEKADKQQELMQCESKKAQNTQQIQIMKDRYRLMKRLVAKVPEDDGAASEEDPAVHASRAKFLQVAHADLQVLAGGTTESRKNKFAGVEEVLLVSTRAIQDVQSSLKEINEGVPGGGGTRGDSKSLQQAIEYLCLTMRDANGMVEKSMKRASHLMAMFHKETSTANAEGRNSSDVRHV